MLLRIATRKSQLALWQTEHVAARLRALDPALQIELLPLSTRGDEVLDRSLSTLGGKGLFLKELELAMERGEADIAVHSLKDVPVDLEPGFTLAAILEREDPADAFVSNDHADLAALPHGAVVGTSSLRRHAQLKALRPDLEVRDLRGNVNTRLAKLDGGDYDAIILAVAGLKRLGFDARIRARLSAPEWLPAAAQGAICIEARRGDNATIKRVRALHHSATAARIEAERALNRRLGGSCQVPIGAIADIEGNTLHLAGLVGHATSGRVLHAKASGPLSEPVALGEMVAQALLAAGAGELLQL